MTTALEAALIRRYGGSGPRYTSYPTAPNFHDSFGEEDYRALAARGRGPLSLYLHLPFCPSPCFYCACTRIITRRPELMEDYVRMLEREIAMQGALFGRGRSVEQLAWGGGTPTYHTPAQMAALMMALDRHFLLSRSRAREFTVEIDPRTVDAAGIRLLAALGFNRASLGVQDFHPEVQAAVNRVQPVALVGEVLAALRASDFASVNFDLIYGLPDQTVCRLADTLQQVVEMRPERIALYSYAHLPVQFKAQRRIDTGRLPTGEAKLELLQTAVAALEAAGYLHIGMDHFALPGDALAEAWRRRTLQRNFQGYSTGAGRDLVGMGVSAISSVADGYSQNHSSLVAWRMALAQRRLPVARGMVLDADDLLRRDVIQALMCCRRIDFAEIERRYGIVFARYFARELRDLQPLARDGLIALDSDGIQVLPRGRQLLRAIARVFDAWLLDRDTDERYSSVV